MELFLEGIKMCPYSRYTTLDLETQDKRVKISGVFVDSFLTTILSHGKT